LWSCMPAGSATAHLQDGIASEAHVRNGEPMAESDLTAGSSCGAGGPGSSIQRASYPSPIGRKGAINKIGSRVRCKTIALSAEKAIDLGRTRVGSPRHSVRPFKRRAPETRFLKALSATLTIVTMRSSVLQVLRHISMRVFGVADAHALFWAEASDGTSLYAFHCFFSFCMKLLNPLFRRNGFRLGSLSNIG